MTETEATIATQRPHRVVGFDPGLKLTGFGVIEMCAGQPKLVEGGVIRIPTGQSLSERLDHLYRQATELLAEHRPGTVAIEDLYSHYDRPRTAILMGHARGVLFLAAAQYGARVAGYLPTRVKKLMTGSGRASKEQMQRAVQAQFSLPQAPEPADVADAIAVALCHYYARDPAA